MAPLARRCKTAFPAQLSMRNILSYDVASGSEITPCIKLINHVGENCIQNFHFGRYIVAYTVGNIVIRRRVSEAVKRDFRMYNRFLMV